MFTPIVREFDCFLITIFWNGNHLPPQGFLDFLKTVSRVLRDNAALSSFSQPRSCIMSVTKSHWKEALCYPQDSYSLWRDKLPAWLPGALKAQHSQVPTGCQCSLHNKPCCDARTNKENAPLPNCVAWYLKPHCLYTSKYIQASI